MISSTFNLYPPCISPEISSLGTSSSSLKSGEWPVDVASISDLLDDTLESGLKYHSTPWQITDGRVFYNDIKWSWIQTLFLSYPSITLPILKKRALQVSLNRKFKIEVPSDLPKEEKKMAVGKIYKDALDSNSHSLDQTRTLRGISKPDHSKTVKRKKYICEVQRNSPATSRMSATKKRALSTEVSSTFNPNNKFATFEKNLIRYLNFYADQEHLESGKVRYKNIQWDTIKWKLIWRFDIPSLQRAAVNIGNKLGSFEIDLSYQKHSLPLSSYRC